MKLIDVTKRFVNDEQCLDYIEQMRWPNGVCCIHCGVLNVSKKDLLKDLERAAEFDQSVPVVNIIAQNQCGWAIPGKLRTDDICLGKPARIGLLVITERQSPL